jgi:hypothetical protein
MGLPITDSLYWNATVALQAGAYEQWTFCLEADECLTVSLTATHPIDAVLTDWVAYSDWERAGFEGMPSGHHFVNESRRASWEDTVIDPPYMLVLVVANPSGQESRVSVQAAIRQTMQTAEHNCLSAPSSGMRKPATQLKRVRWGGSGTG